MDSSPLIFVNFAAIRTCRTNTAGGAFRVKLFASTGIAATGIYRDCCSTSVQGLTHERLARTSDCIEPLRGSRVSHGSGFAKAGMKASSRSRLTLHPTTYLYRAPQL